jgi:2'-5' RNA ligase
MQTDYVEDVDHWDEGQRAYRFGVILILPPEPIFTQVNDLRAQHDPISQAICDAHISLTVPLPRSPSDAQWAEIEAVTSSTRPFTIHYGPLMTYPPYPGVVLKIEPQTELDRLRIGLEACSAFHGVPSRPYPFSAHMTIAEFITIERTNALMAELNGTVDCGSFRCDSVSHAVPDPSFHFSECRRLLFRR